MLPGKIEAVNTTYNAAMPTSDIVNMQDSAMPENRPAERHVILRLAARAGLGTSIAMAVAGVLVIRANLPRLLFGDTSKFNWMWPATVFVGYTLLGIIVLACIASLELLLRKYPDLPMRRHMAAGSALILAGTALITYGLIPPVSSAMVGGKPYLPAMWTISSALGIVGYACFLMHRAAATQRQRELQLQLEADALGTAVAGAELAMLEAQIEPHFLFNTLAHVKRQYRIDAGAADQMLAALIEYLDRALPALKRADWTLGDELDLIQAYLYILQRRFGERFRFVIMVPDMYRSVRLPALTAATLAENAIRHGLAPKSDGGTVSIRAEADDASLRIEVCDNGAGLRNASGNGLGIATVRARLLAAFGNQASLVIEPNRDAGVRASIRIPASS